MRGRHHMGGEARGGGTRTHWGIWDHFQPRLLRATWLCTEQFLGEPRRCWPSLEPCATAGLLGKEMTRAVCGSFNVFLGNFGLAPLLCQCVQPDG